MPNAVMRYSSISPLVFDGTVAQCFVVSMRNTVTSTRIKNVAPGVLYVFVFQQDHYGEHDFRWPTECINATPIDQVPFSTTTQSFLGIAGGLLRANAPGTWSEG